MSTVAMSTVAVRAAGRGVAGRGVAGRGVASRSATGRAAVSNAGTSAGVRLTRRGRLVVLLMVLAVMVVMGMLLGHGSGQASTGGSHGPATRTVTVQPGESLWSVAARVAPHQDPRLVVATLESMNSLPGSGLIAGQQLTVPAS